MSFKVISFDAYDTILSTKEELDKICEIMRPNCTSVWRNNFWKRFSIGMDLEFKKLTNDEEYVKASVLYHRAIKSSNLLSGTQVNEEQAVNLIYFAHSNAKALRGISNLIQKLRKQYIVVILSDADNKFLNSALYKNNIVVDLVISSEDATGYKTNKNNNVFKYFIKKFGVQSSDIVHVGDSDNDEIGTLNSGIEFWRFNPFGRPFSSNRNQNIVENLSDLESKLIK